MPLYPLRREPDNEKARDAEWQLGSNARATRIASDAVGPRGGIYSVVVGFFERGFKYQSPYAPDEG